MPAISMNFRFRFATSLALLLFVLSATAQARLYKWVDEEGNVHYTDKIPPAQVERGHDTLSDKGIRVDSVAPAMTAEEIQREKELERRRKQQERLIAAQRAADRSLLSNYRNADDLLLARDGQLASVDVMTQATKGNIRRQQEWLRRLRSEAANLERAGKELTPDLQDRITRTEHEINSSYASIVSREQQKQKIRDDFDRDLRRFIKLKGLPDETLADKIRQPPQGNLARCGSADACTASWQRATAYVRAQANTPVLHVGEILVINEPPTKDGDVSLALSLIRDDAGGGASLYLDLQCKRFETSEVACKTEPGVTVLAGFKAAVTGDGDQAGSVSGQQKPGTGALKSR